VTANEEIRYGIDELAARGGVSRRTVRYYVERGLLPAPTGVGRGKHYTEAHLSTLIRIRELQEASVPLDEIAERILGRPRVPCSEPEPQQTTWTHVELSPDVALLLRGQRLTPEQVRKLIAVIRETLGDIEP
jgi:DNA-binding transcriptional MerR regulator